ncbi:MAG TPA: VOC family protein [Gammaproteobacteria bacterium]|nr:VOC family protein [Xanthomonadales bacterium]MCB1594058.1 VOC family protein [Xanthomonadales bacterium]HOP22748.1 VOC family protein [Gammaproteobacteria bacterium]HPI96383.1 VOC family protein [Gammaproteobacteria bacterium]HPQ86535.1 VOC family protein [Gammaproteobacteria bacterium]
MNNPVGWFEIYVSDMARAKIFYETVLNIRLGELVAPNDQSIQMKIFPSDMDKYGATGALVKMEGFPVGGNSVLVYFSCDDCSVEESRIELAGGKVEKSKFSIGEYGFISLAIDTEGNIFGLHSLK